MRRKKADAQQTKEKLLKSALKLFGSKGIDAATVEDIARATHVTRGAFYWHFSGKDAVIAELLTRRMAPLFAIIQTVLETDSSALEKIGLLLTELLHHMEDKTEFRDSFFLDFERSLHTRHGGGSFQELIRNKIEDFVSVLASMIEEGKRAGTIRKDVSTEEVCGFIGCIINGALMDIRLRSLNGSGRFSSVEPHSIAEFTIRAIRT